MVILPLIQAFSKVGDTVLDPFAGSGTTAMAAKQLGRNYIGIELDQEYSRIAQDRLKNSEEH
jgi:site-specific DNA-methyltransferase (adenine-specific)